MKKDLSYSDVSLVPRFSKVVSRWDCDTSIVFLGHSFRLPLMPANMKASISAQQAEWLSKNRYFYSMHRFLPYQNIFDWVEDANRLRLPCISISVGVKEDDKRLISEFEQRSLSPNFRIDFITIDIAHGHSVLMRDMISFVNKALPDVKIIAGNVATPEGVCDLQDWGADAVKIGIGQGHTCTTRLQTGFGLPMFSCIKECTEVADVPIIADGGIGHVGDIAKALVAGADMVMAGSMFARCLDSPAETDDGWIYFKRHKERKKDYDGKVYKTWYGSSTHYNKGYSNNDEGRMVKEESNYMTYEEFLAYAKEHLQSAISYAGGNNLYAFEKVKYKIV